MLCCHIAGHPYFLHADTTSLKQSTTVQTAGTNVSRTLNKETTAGIAFICIFLSDIDFVWNNLFLWSIQKASILLRHSTCHNEPF